MVRANKTLFMKPKTFQEALQTVQLLRLKSVGRVLHRERAPLVKLVWALVALCFWQVKNKSL